ncbi:MAG: hypothetical protein A2001_00380 [Treponema sp. GWC1_61_84]|nr:MAG: hypothetical protein A2001_00380 [Treponema sp. GWC1_61_84]
MKSLVLSCFVFLAVLVSPMAQTASQITIASDTWASCTEKDGSGLYFDILRLVFGNSGASLDIRMVPFARSVQMLESGKADISVGNYVGDIAKGLYPKLPIDYDDVTVLMRKERAFLYSGEKSLGGKKVAWITDYGYDAHLASTVELTEVSDREGGISMLRSGRIDYYIENRASILDALREMKLDEDDFVLDTIKYLKIYICFSDTEKGRRLRDTWDRKYAELIDSGKLKPLFAKWENPASYELLIKGR